MKEFLQAFKALRHAPVAFWLCIFVFTFDGMAYFGVLPLMKSFISQDIGIRPALASWWVSLFTGALTIGMLFVGRPMEGRFGIRRSLLLALFLIVTGRLVYASAPFLAGSAQLAVSLAVVAVGEGIAQVVCYAGVKRYTTKETSSMGFALLYAGLNFGAMAIGPISSGVRKHFDEPFKAGTSKLSGFNAVNFTCVLVTLVTLVIFAVTMTKKREAEVLRSDTEEVTGTGSSASANRSPYKDRRFLFFIFALLPVRTLFAHQWLTMPEYILRSYPEAVASRMEYFVDSLSPLIVFLGVPAFAALTKRYHVLSMMILGSLVSAAATFLLCFGPITVMLFAYFFVFSIGESLWSSRFYEYAAELAPAGRVAQYMGVASLPWFVAKMTTGFYSGFILERFVPKDGDKATGTMWLIYGLIAMVSPLALFAARKWLRVGMTAKEQPA